MAMPRSTSARAETVEITSDHLVLVLRDGRTLAVPLDSLPSLRDATPSQRSNWQLIGGGAGISWPDIDEDISVAGLLRDAGWPSARSKERRP